MTTTRESGALRYEQLSGEEIDAILEIEKRLSDARDDGPLVSASERKKAADTYLERVEDRHSRILLIDGGRGTGKTSLLLTLIKRWNESDDCTSASTEEHYASDRLARLRAVVPTHIKVVRNLDFDPLPPRMPVMAGLIQAWRPIAEAYDKASGRADCENDDPTFVDLWHSLFSMAARGWSEAPQQGLLEQVLDREQQVQDWLDLSKKWKEFIDALVECGRCLTGDMRLDAKPVFVVVIDDCDLQVDRVREILPALRLLYHARVFFLVAAHSPHMRDMLNLDYMGQENGLAGRRGSSEATEGLWSADLAAATFEKVFPKSNTWRLRALSLRELLSFPDRPPGEGYPIGDLTFFSLLNDIESSVDDELAGQFLWKFANMAEDAGLPGIMTYRSAHQLHEYALSLAARKPARTVALEVLAGVIAPSRDNAVVAGSRGDEMVDVGTVGEVAALFRPELVDFAGYDLVFSTKADFTFVAYRQTSASRMSLDSGSRVNFTGLLVAKALEEKRFPVYAAGLRWDTYLSLAWTEWQLPAATFVWNRHKHPRPDQLLRQIREWSICLNELRAERYVPEFYAYAWLHYQKRWSSYWWFELGAYDDAPVPELSLSEIKDGATGGWREISRLSVEDYPLLDSRQFASEDKEWRDRMLPLMARPEIGLPPLLQRKLASGRDRRRDPSLRKLRRRYMTDAIIASSAQRSGDVRSIPSDTEVEEAVKIVEEDYSSRHGVDSVWAEIEDPAKRRRNQKKPAALEL